MKITIEIPELDAEVLQIIANLRGCSLETLAQTGLVQFIDGLTLEEVTKTAA